MLDACSLFVRGGSFVHRHTSPDHVIKPNLQYSSQRSVPDYTSNMKISQVKRRRILGQITHRFSDTTSSKERKGESWVRGRQESNGQVVTSPFSQKGRMSLVMPWINLTLIK